MAEDEAEVATTDESSPPLVEGHISRATYPLPEPLVLRLKAGIVNPPPPSSTRSTRRNVDDVHEALAQLVGNSIEAMDAMYFSTPARIRKHPAFSHRLCLRVRASKEPGGGGTLSLTDLGVGMTRADLINSLGIGRAGLLSSDNSTSYNDHNNSVEKRRGMFTSSSSSKSETDSTDQEDFEEDSHRHQRQKHRPRLEARDNLPETNGVASHQDQNVVSCRVSELGGFYAALCSLGVGVRVGTKAKHDEYYEFEVGLMDSNEDGGSRSLESAYESFRIRRPRAEGTQLTVENGFDKFQDVRGESGTCVIIRLNAEAVAAGLLDEEKLKSLFLSLLQATPYTVAFSSDKGAQAIIDASAQEAIAIAELLQEPEDPLEAVADMDLGPMRMLETSGSHNSVKERAKYIPLRLSLGERKMLRLVEAAMSCCEYTTEVDRPFKSSARRTHEQLKGITSILRGLVTACDYEAGQKLMKDDNFVEYEKFFRTMLEIARRHKIMNPEKMRTEYGKLVYVLQDAVSPSVKPHLGFSVKGPIQSVYNFLESRNGLDLLSDKLIETATEEILAERKSRATIDQEIRQKERAVAIIKRKYKTTRLSAEDIHLCLYSICDNNSFLNSNRVPIDKIIDYLTSHFSPHQIEEGYSLSIVSGEDGARLSHSHERQYYYALQSLTLWRDIIDDMFRLWAMAEEDLLSESVTYSLQDTGQGMQRVQQSPRTYQAMQQILQRVQNKVSHWVGSSVIHMGDHNVPNALSFIDKYTQVPRILSPIVACLENLERICEKDDGIQKMIDNGFGGLDKLRMDILYDFFRSAFDGSGADNFYDAGSCIDGRMTSAWNWCSQLPSKPFYPIFKLTGFIGFDGEFK